MCLKEGLKEGWRGAMGRGTSLCRYGGHTDRKQTSGMGWALVRVRGCYTCGTHNPDDQVSLPCHALIAHARISKGIPVTTC